MFQKYAYAIVAIVFLVLDMDVAGGMMIGCLLVDTGVRDKINEWFAAQASKEK